MKSFFIILFAAVALAGCGGKLQVDSRLESPANLWSATQEAAQPSKVYINPEALPILAQMGVDLGGADASQAPLDPTEWRRLDRRSRFEAVLLLGEPSRIAALASHLAESPDFRIAEVDNWGVLFVRGLPRRFLPPNPEDLEAFEEEDQQAQYLSQLAINLELIGESDAARDHLRKAREIAPEIADPHVATAFLELHRGRLPGAVSAADKALEIRPQLVPALEIKAQALAEAGQHEAAWHVAEQLLEAAPQNNMQILFLHARLAKAANAYSREQASLEQLIRLADEAGLSSTPYRVYLAQSFARQGLPRPAIAEFELALADPELDARQRSDLENALATVKQKSGL